MSCRRSQVRNPRDDPRPLPARRRALCGRPLLCTRLGVAAAELIREGKFGNMVAVQNDRIVPVPLKEVAGRLKTVPVDGELVHAARELGLCMGD